MDDTTDDLEELFDYHRVQPINFIPIEDDDSDTPPFKSKRRKFNKADDYKKVDKYDDDMKPAKVADIVDLDDDEEDWLPPPPKNVAPAVRREEDSAIKQLRQKKLELASLVQSAANAIKAVEEATSRAANSFLDSTMEKTVEEPPKPAADRAKILVSIQDKAGTKQYRVYADDKFEQLFRKYAEKANIGLEKLVFKFDGDKIDLSSTPNSLGMEDEDLIEVNVKAS